MAIQLSRDRDDLLTDYAVGMLKDFYMRDYENHPKKHIQEQHKLGQPIKEPWMKLLQHVYMNTLAKNGLCLLVLFFQMLLMV